MQDFVQKLESLAVTEHPVLIQGPAGSNFEEIARKIHAASSHAENDFLVVECKDLQTEDLDNLAMPSESTHYSDEMRAGDINSGTVFLDHINAMSLQAQARLSVILDQSQKSYSKAVEGTDVPRYIASSDTDLEEDANAGRIRNDLFYMISAFTLEVPVESAPEPAAPPAPEPPAPAPVPVAPAAPEPPAPEPETEPPAPPEPELVPEVVPEPIPAPEPPAPPAPAPPAPEPVLEVVPEPIPESPAPVPAVPPTAEAVSRIAPEVVEEEPLKRLEPEVSVDVSVNTVNLIALQCVKDVHIEVEESQMPILQLMQWAIDSKALSLRVEWEQMLVSHINHMRSWGAEQAYAWFVGASGEFELDSTLTPVATAISLIEQLHLRMSEDVEGYPPAVE